MYFYYTIFLAQSSIITFLHVFLETGIDFCHSELSLRNGQHAVVFIVNNSKQGGNNGWDLRDRF
jgi:hypothetical protein